MESPIIELTTTLPFNNEIKSGIELCNALVSWSARLRGKIAGWADAVDSDPSKLIGIIAQQTGTTPEQATALYAILNGFNDLRLSGPISVIVIR